MSAKTKLNEAPATNRDNGERPGEALALAVAEAERAVQAAEADRDAHQGEIERSIQEKAALTETLDQLTLAGDSPAAERTADRLGAVEKLIDSRTRTLAKREAAIQEARKRLFEAKREQGRHRLVELAEILEERNRLTIEHLDAAAKLQEANILDRSEAEGLSGEFGLDRVRCQLAVPKHVIRSKGMEMIRSRVDEAHAFGVTITPER